MKTEILNCKIESTMLGDEDHGIFTCFLHLSGDGWGCGFGGYTLDSFDKLKNKRVATAYGLTFIKRILETLEVSKWESLKGTLIRAETEGLGGGIVRIGHITKNRWFNPATDPELLTFAKQEAAP